MSSTPYTNTLDGPPLVAPLLPKLMQVGQGIPQLNRAVLGLAGNATSMPLTFEMDDTDSSPWEANTWGKMLLAPTVISQRVNIPVDLPEVAFIVEHHMDALERAAEAGDEEGF